MFLQFCSSFVCFHSLLFYYPIFLDPQTTVPATAATTSLPGNEIIHLTSDHTVIAI